MGEKCSVRISNIYLGNMIVELEQGVIERVLNGAVHISNRACAAADVVEKM